MAVIKKSPLELFVSSFVEQKSRMKFPLIYVEKSLQLIHEKLDSTCCSDPSGTVTYSTFKDNSLTNAVRMYLKNMPRTSANLKSLQRAYDKLNIFYNFCSFCEAR